MIVSLLVLALFAMPNPAAAQDAPRFPSVSGENLLGQSFELPGDLPGDPRLVFVAFRQRQQGDVNTWLAIGDALESDHPGLRYFELPTISWPYRIMKPMIDNGMRSGIPSDDARGRTITLFTRVGTFVEETGLPDTDEIAVFLIDADGRIRWSTTGRHSAEKEAELRSAISGLSSAG